jgi:hypothetical protein|tara:strand:+ start:357 stop:512 length:156 start_codon:yes stop_codon:yes gene_type:complete
MTESKAKLAAYYYCNNFRLNPISQKEVSVIFNVNESSLRGHWKKILRCFEE